MQTQVGFGKKKLKCMVAGKENNLIHEIEEQQIMFSPTMMLLAKVFLLG